MADDKKRPTVGDRLSVTSDDIIKMLPQKPRNGHITLTEDLRVRVSMRNI